MTNYCHRLLLTMLFIASATNCFAQEANTIFFDNNGIETGVTTPGATSFSFRGSNWSGGIVATEGSPPLYASGAWSYEVPTGPALVTFDNPVTDISFFYVHGNGFAAGTATAMAGNGAVLGTVNSNIITSFGDQANFESFSTTEPIASIEFSAGVIDNFSFSLFTAPPSPFNFQLAEGAWLNPDTDGEGILFDFGPTLNLLFGAWFTFTLDPVVPIDPPATDIGFDGQRWITALMTLEGNLASGPLRARQGGAFDMPPTESGSSADVGEITIEFLDCDLARVDYIIDSAGGISGSFNIQPLEQVVNPNGFSCSLDGTPANN